MVPMDQPEHALYMFTQFLTLGGKLHADQQSGEELVEVISE